jgi:hypothetical protein
VFQTGNSAYAKEDVDLLGLNNFAYALIDRLLERVLLSLLPSIAAGGATELCQ